MRRCTRLWYAVRLPTRRDNQVRGGGASECLMTSGCAPPLAWPPGEEEKHPHELEKAQMDRQDGERSLLSCVPALAWSRPPPALRGASSHESASCRVPCAQVSGMPVDKAMAQLYFSKKRHSAELQQAFAGAAAARRLRLVRRVVPTYTIITFRLRPLGLCR